MDTNWRLLAIAMCVAVCGAVPAWAAPVDITYTANNLALNVWEYQYTIVNNLTTPISEFTIWFDWGDPLHAIPDYQDIKDESMPDIKAKWSSLVADPLVPGPTGAGYFDELAILPADAIQPGGTLTELVATFVWNGPGTPGAQPFQVDDSSGNVLFTGATVLLPEPVTCLIMAAGACGFLWIRRAPRRKRA